MAEFQEVLEGYVVDLGCLRKYSRGELLERARTHTRECALMGHCLESGYGLVDEDGRVSLLDSEATLRVVDAVRSSERRQGIKLRVVRELQDGKMQTSEVQVTTA